MFLSYVPELFGNLDTMYAPKDPYIQSNTAYDQRNLSSRFKARIAPKTEIKAGVYASTTSSINRFDRYLETKNNMPKYAKWNYGPQTWTMGYLSIENRSEAKAFDWIKATASVQYFEESRDVRKFKYLVGRVQREQVYIGQLNIDASKKLAPWANLLYGAEILRNDVRSTAWQYHERMPDTTWATQTRYANGSYWESASLFASANLDLASNLTLSSGLRMNGVHMYSPISFNGFEQEADLRFTAPSAELGLTYYRPTFKYFLNLSTGFRAPNVDDASKVFDSQPGALIIPNPDLHEERLYSAELGMKQKLGSKWAVDASFYYSYLDEALERAPYNFQGRDSVFYDNEFSQVLAIQNIDYAWIWGYQFGIRTDLSDNLHWMIHWAHPFGYDSKGNPLRHAHPFNATSTLSYQKEKLRTNLVLRYNGSVDADEMPFSELEKTFIYAINENGELYTPAWYTINVYGSYHFSKNILVRLGIENLMDLRYRSYSSGIAAPGRSVYFSVRMSL
jgi:hemoglobin/transferrin/lactoferrin receptor protein